MKDLWHAGVWPLPFFKISDNLRWDMAAANLLRFQRANINSRIFCIALIVNR